MADPVDKFLSALETSLRDGTFIKLTLGNYKGTEFQLQRILGRRIKTSKGDQVSLTFRYKTRDITKNFPVDEASVTIRGLFGEGFHSGHLFTEGKDYQLEMKKDGRAKLSVSAGTATSVPPSRHDRDKKAQIDPSATYLASLGITDRNGRVLDRQRDKWRQINKYIEILASLLDKSALADTKELVVFDMGSGKGYLTFAAYDYLSNVRKVRPAVTGVELRQELVDLCNQVAGESGFRGLNFVRGSIAGTEVPDLNLLIALHACDTATDDAIYKGIKAGAQLIITAPCCHQEVRPQIRPPEVLRDILKQGTLLEHEAETLTDGLRAMLLDANGYAAKVFEFVGVEHTPKNNMIVGTRIDRKTDKVEVNNRIKALMDFYGVREQRLWRLLERSADVNAQILD
jgi:SAM-dependent methyltransferase